MASTTDIAGTQVSNNNQVLNQTSYSDAVVNPDGVLDKDDFLKLFLTELKYQDPTSPMDTDKILTQTADMATLETMENTKKAMENMATAFSSSAGFSLISSVGKVADTGYNGLNFAEGGEEADFDLYFNHDYVDGTITVTDANGDTVIEMDITSGEKGTRTFTWDGLDSNGDPVEAGAYKIDASYTDSAGKQYSTRMGLYPIQSVRFSGTEPSFKLGGEYYSMEDIMEIYEPDILE